MIWLNYASDYGVDGAKKIIDECQIKKNELVNESSELICMKNKILNLQDSNK
jgi:hypothetical protein